MARLTEAKEASTLLGMEPSAALFVVRRRTSRARRNSSVPVIVFAILAIAGAVAPPVLLAAETPVETQRNGVVVFIMIVLLFGSVAAGLFFASPLRRRFIRSPVAPANPAGVALAPDQPTARARVATHAWPAPGRAPADELLRPAGTRAEPTYVPEGQSFDARPVAYDADVRYPQPQPQRPGSAEPPVARPILPRPVSPWSTGAPQPDANWDPAGQRRPS